MSYNHGGYDNEDGFNGRDRSQKENLFRPETMREILSNAAQTGSHDLGPELMASINSHSNPNPQRSSSYSQGNRQSPPRSSASRQNSGLTHTPPRDSNYGSSIETYRDANGDLVQASKSGEDLPLRVQTNDPEWNSLSRGPPSRTNTGHSTYRNAEGDHVAEHRGGNLPVTTHGYHHSPPASEGRRSPPIYETRDREGNRVQQYDGDSENLAVRAHHVWHD